MHADSERGVAAHWRYKEGGRGNQAYERKINELRSLLTPAEGAGGSRDFLDRVRVDLFQDRIYVVSPKGEIVDVPVGGTPLDFAYQVHTDLGHRTRGAKVNGRMVPLDYRLKNSETVEIITAKTSQPSRDWLSAQSGFLASPRHRNKVRAWFRKQNEAQNKVEGRAMLERELQRLGLKSPPMPELLRELELDNTEALHEALGLGEISSAQLAGAMQRLLHARDRRIEPVRTPGSSRAPELPCKGSAISCRPMRVAASPCRRNPSWATSPSAAASASTARLAPIWRGSKLKSPARVLAVDWGKTGSGEFPVDIEVQAFDRRGLVRDVSAALADEKISIQGMTTVTDKHDNVAHMRIGISISGLPQLSKVLSRIAQLPNVISAKTTRNRRGGPAASRTRCLGRRAVRNRDCSGFGGPGAIHVAEAESQRAAGRGRRRIGSAITWQADPTLDARAGEAARRRSPAERQRGKIRRQSARDIAVIGGEGRLSRHCCCR